MEGEIEFLGYRWHCGKCRATQDFANDRGGVAYYGAVDDADAAGWRHTDKHGWLCPGCGRKTRSLRHTYEESDAKEAGQKDRAPAQLPAG
jgi:hypothetical protein